MALYHKWDVKNDFVYVLQFFSLITDSLGSSVGPWAFGLMKNRGEECAHTDKNNLDVSC